MNKPSVAIPIKKSFAHIVPDALIYYNRKVYMLIGFVMISQLILSSIIEMGTDESYYWLYAQKLQWNYFDHPPIVAIWGRIFTLNLLLQHIELFVRLGSITSCALSTYFMYRTVATIHSERAGWYSAILYTCSFYASLVAGLLIMPDSPQMLFWTLSLWFLVRIINDEKKLLNWIIFGIAAGLCIMSKIHGAFLWIGLGLFTITYRKYWLKQKGIYIAALITAAIASPILIWNINHDFATYNFHSERVSIIGRAFHYTSFYNEVIGQLVFNNPFNVILIVISIIAVIKRKIKRYTELPLFLLTGIPMALLLIFVSIFRPTFPHWSGPAYISLIPLAAIYLAALKNISVVDRWKMLSFGSFLFFIIVWPLFVHYYPGTWGSKTQYQLGKGDVTLDRYGWEEAGEAFSVSYMNAVAKGQIPLNTPVVSYKWWGAHIEYYFCRPANAEMIGLGPLKEIHHYMWVNNRRKNKVDMANAICIVPSDEYYEPAEKYSMYYSNFEKLQSIDVYRNNKMAKQYHVYLLSGWKGKLPVWQDPE